jgi:signal transduction histidine kinase
MELNRSKNWPYYLLGFSILFILVLGGWWLYLVFTLAYKLKELHSPILKGNLLMMVQWEGITFLTITLIVGIAIFYVFYQDNKKTRATQLFYASLTHELKTPLTSMRLQSQVILDFLSNLDLQEDEKNKIQKYSERLEEDSIRLEDEIDRHLQLSRLELASDLNLESINLTHFIQELSKKYGLSIKMNDTEQEVLADQTALYMIFKNLFENTIRHQNHEKEILINFVNNNQYLKVIYDDQGAPFEGDISQLGKLFYKHNSPKGTGIGLYLIKKLILKQNGLFKITKAPHLVFEISLPRSLDHE